MNDQPARKSHVWTWILSLLVAVPVLYFLSLGPVTYYEAKEIFAGRVNRPGWAEVYWAPAILLHENTPLRGPLESYTMWWNELAMSRQRASHPSGKPAI